MFTGIIKSQGRINSIVSYETDTRVSIQITSPRLIDLSIGDSIAVNGVCVTVIDLPESHALIADISQETLSCTTFSQLTVDSIVNLEPAMQLSDRLDGHLVTGHVDGVGSLVKLHQIGRSCRMEISPPVSLMKYIAKKASIAVDGVSLTVNECLADSLEVNIIPHTLETTILSDYKVGIQVNLEVDLIARYLENLYKKGNS